MDLPRWKGASCYPTTVFLLQNWLPIQKKKGKLSWECQVAIPYGCMVASYIMSFAFTTKQPDITYKYLQRLIFVPNIKIFSSNIFTSGHFFFRLRWLSWSPPLDRCMRDPSLETYRCSVEPSNWWRWMEMVTIDGFCIVFFLFVEGRQHFSFTFEVARFFSFVVCHDNVTLCQQSTNLSTACAEGLQPLGDGVELHLLSASIALQHLESRRAKTNGGEVRPGRSKLFETVTRRTGMTKKHGKSWGTRFWCFDVHIFGKNMEKTWKIITWFVISFGEWNKSNMAVGRIIRNRIVAVFVRDSKSQLFLLQL